MSHTVPETTAVSFQSQAEVGSSINEKADYMSVYHFQPTPYPGKETLYMYAFIWMPFCYENNAVWDEKIRDAWFFWGFSLLLQANIAFLYHLLLKGNRCLESVQRYRDIEIKRMGYKMWDMQIKAHRLIKLQYPENRSKSSCNMNFRCL